MIYIVTGAIESGKTSLVSEWSKGREDVYGILTPNDPNGIRHLMDLRTQERFPMQADIYDATKISVGRYHFYKSAFVIGNQILEDTLETTEKGYIVIDELGKLELQNKGFHSSARLVINATKNNPNLHGVLVIRTYLLEDIKRHFDIENSALMDFEELPTSTGNCVT